VLGIVVKSNISVLEESGPQQTINMKSTIELLFKPASVILNLFGIFVNQVCIFDKKNGFPKCFCLKDQTK